jgi:GR25 family glycosyltransferase involved in LPS biosynthesis
MAKKKANNRKTDNIPKSDTDTNQGTNQTKWYDYIDQFVYINLDHRTDRNATMIRELTRMKIPITKFQRIQAVRNERGAIGCTFSHIKSLQLAIEKKWKNVLIMEDDFIFVDSPEKVESGIRYFFENVVPKVPDWTVINLSRGASQQMRPIDKDTYMPLNPADPSSFEKSDSLIWKADAISSASGYIVNHTFFQTLLNNYREGLVGLMKTYDKPTYACDMYWFPLQRNTNWYIFNPSIGYQYESYSDIEQRMVDYVAFDKSLSFDKKSYLTVNLKGGLGNQMFQIAAGCSIAWLNQMEPIFEKIYESPSIFQPRPVYWSSLFKNVPVKKTYEMEKIPMLQVQYPSNAYSPVRISHNKNHCIDGYFQNPQFFEPFRNKIIEMFQLPHAQMSALRSLYRVELLKNVLKPTVMIHVRRGDYMKLSHIHTVQPVDYYTRAISFIESQVDTHKDAIGYSSSELTYVVFSDDIEWCKQNIVSLDNVDSPRNWVFIDDGIRNTFKKTAELKDVPEDVCEMMLMTLCDHLIICNSTFSWWGAYLNRNPRKLIIAPKTWFEDPEKNNDGMNIIDRNMITL